MQNLTAVAVCHIMWTYVGPKNFGMLDPHSLG